ncbi:tRNA glutamyl-Q(34) synthetase GluQRS [Sphingomicrobium lutaoense]|uniref:Glutamyl-Q tRNA(Asp) synthetase n=1 Tax=Sphingomicrobium lutaoense TaxID=515949 RepID=A0A839Z284_9SPHN|nr:tRNA glutamyl-Q(34) synthetase GluQRS [Sphingomicrobium lutaoense]MBB3764668.1 glutamyl-Q tRNA(Asp) synthetase [Sphingomicrobium lutaoense]
MVATRFAPSPTGRLHLGHAYSAAMALKAARAAGGVMRLRIDDLDQGRSRPEHVEGIFEDLRWLGIGWDGEVLFESERSDEYASGLERLRERGLVYPCFCTRADIQEALAAPHGPGGAHYPGTCRGRPDDPARRAREAHSWRLDAGRALDVAGGLPTWREEGRLLRSGREDFDDVILARKDAPASYHLACVIDDAAQGVTLVVRGADLRASTPVQRLLQELLGLGEPDYLHHRLVTFEDGRRLAKRDLAPTLAAMREEGVDGRELAARLMDQSLPLGFRLTEPT